MRIIDCYKKKEKKKKVTLWKILTISYKAKIHFMEPESSSISFNSGSDITELDSYDESYSEDEEVKGCYMNKPEYTNEELAKILA